MQCDPEGNRLAGTKPRTWAAFEAKWEEILREPQQPGTDVIPRVIIADGTLVGVINIFPQENTPSIGYWLDRAHWGRGIATRAIALMVGEVTQRPLYARVVVHNAASLGALQRNGFVIESRRYEPEDERYVAGEVVTLRLPG